MEPPTLLMVRSTVPEDLRSDFDLWYGSDHSPKATGILGATRFWRFWSDTEPGVHFAFYEFPDAQTAVAAQGLPGNADLIAEYDDRWSGRIHRTREIMSRADDFPAV